MTLPATVRRILICTLTAASACGSDDGATAPDTGADTLIVDSVGADADADAGDVAAPQDTGTDVVATPVPAICAELGLPVRPMQAGTGSAFHDIAGDFTVATTDGPWTLSQQWTGCESYVFVNYADTETGAALWESQADQLVLSSPRNVHYFFASYAPDAAAADARALQMLTRVERAYLRNGFDAERIAFWRGRMHFVVEPIQGVVGGIGDLVRANPFIQHAVGIGRDQRFDPVGSLSGAGAGAPSVSMAAYAGHYYNYLAALRARLAAESATTVVPVLAAETVTDRVIDRDVALPDAAAMGVFDTLEVDVAVHCRQGPADCSAWDRIAYVRWCEDADCTATRELVRSITPYSRPGLRRWVMDASPMLAWLRPGGAQRFRVVMGPTWEAATEREVTVSLRLSARGGPRSVQALPAFAGGTFDAAYNDQRDGFAFTAPLGTTRVELVALISGHGQDAGNCAEWCPHEHRFAVDGGAAHVVSYSGIGGALGCADRAALGVVPGQYGNWAPRRAGWCPGEPVETVRVDLTDAVTPGVEHLVTYEGTYDGGGVPPGGTINLSAFVVFFE